MNVYIQQVFPDKTVFGNNLQDFCISDFEEIPQQEEAEGKETVMNLLHNSVTRADTSNGTEQNDRFQSIIDFPNFLLIVLKVSMMKIAGFDYKAFKLDDKELLVEFKKVLDGKEPEQRQDFAREFAFNLLRLGIYWTTTSFIILFPTKSYLVIIHGSCSIINSKTARAIL